MRADNMSASAQSDQSLRCPPPSNRSLLNLFQMVGAVLSMSVVGPIVACLWLSCVLALTYFTLLYLVLCHVAAVKSPLHHHSRVIFYFLRDH